MATVIKIDPSVELGSISRSMYGSCIEDVNHEIYGGLYAQCIYGESFEEPVPGSKPAGWQVYGGNWVPDGAGVHVSSGPGFKLMLDEAIVGDQEIEADVAIANDFGFNAGFLVKSSSLGVGADEFDGYEISISPKDARVIIGKHRHDFHQLAEAPAKLTYGRWHHLRVKVTGNLIEVFIDRANQPQLVFEDKDQPLIGGQVGLRTWHSDCSFRKVKVNGKPVSFDWSGVGTSPRWDFVKTPGGKGVLSTIKDAYHGSYAQRITNQVRGELTGVANRGLNKWGISCLKNETMDGLIAVRGQDIPVTIAIQSADGSRTYSKTTIEGVAPTWKSFQFKLTPNTTDPNCRLAIWIDQRGEVDIDQVQLYQPKSNLYDGLPVRADIVAKMNEAGISYLRYGGTMVNSHNYRWKDMIGKRELRPPHVGHWNSSSTNGFGIFEFLNLCEKMGIGSSFAINAEESPQDAADLADYLTAPVTNPWGKKRADDGHPEPYEVDYLQIGNEECIASKTPAAFNHYCDRFELLTKAIKTRNPKLKIVCAAWWVDDSPEMEKVFRRIDGLASAWDIHVGGDDPNSGSEVDKLMTGIKEKFSRWNPKSDLKVVVFEENGGTHNHRRALGHATNVNAVRRHGDFVLVDCAANCLQPLQQNDNGWDQGQVFFNSSTAWLMPPATANAMLSSTHQPTQIKSEVEGVLDVLATKSKDGRSVVVTAVNKSDQPVPTTVQFATTTPTKGEAKMMSGRLSDANSSDKVRVPIKSVALKKDSSHWTLTMPPFSIATMEFSN